MTPYTRLTHVSSITSYRRPLPLSCKYLPLSILNRRSIGVTSHCIALTDLSGISRRHHLLIRYVPFRSLAAVSQSNFPRLSVAVVGAGPSGFYSAKYLASSVVKRIQPQLESSFPWSGIDIDLIERLPTPFGLVRYGVAPDHPEVKNVQHDFESLLQNHRISKNDDEKQDPACSISYFGNVNVSSDISLSHLSSLYHAVILAYGCQSDKNINIPGQQLYGVLSAREFVAWYNGHIEFGHVGDVVRRCLKKSTSTNVVVVGNGNVALDCARVIAKGKRGLEGSDAPTAVLNVLDGNVGKVCVVGRRGHVQGAFTIKELRELTKLKQDGLGAFVVRQEELDMGMTDASLEEMKGASGRPKTRIDALLREAAASDQLGNDTTKTVEIRFLMNPKRIEPRTPDGDHVGRVIFERTKLEGEPGKQRSVGTGELEEIPADMVVMSVGYRGTQLEGMDDELFDNTRWVIANDHGKVYGDNNFFVSGWIKRGPTGIIGTNIMDSKETVSSVMKFIDSRSPGMLEEYDKDLTSPLLKEGRNGLIRHLDSNGVVSVSWDQFLQIDDLEKSRDRLRNDLQPREKLLSKEEMLACLK